MKNLSPSSFLRVTIWITGMMLSQALNAGEAVEESVRDALLGKQDAKDDHDINRDGKVDVADVIKLARLGSRASFVAASTNAREGQGVVTLALAFSKPISGFIQYEVTGSARSGLDYTAVTGNLLVNGTAANLNLTMREDTILEPVETIIVTLKSPIAGGPAIYLGGQSVHTILLEDNESRWDGWLERDGVQMPLSMTLSQNGAVYQAALATDGGLAMPAGNLPVTNLAVTANSFAMDVGPMVVAAGDTALKADISRTLHFAASPVSNLGHKVDIKDEIVGSFSDEWVVSGTNTAQWNRTGNKAIQGTFHLRRANTAPPLTDPKLATVP